MWYLMKTVFSGKSEDLMDNLMHSTLQEIATWVRSVELPSSLLHGEPETSSFHEDEAIQDEPTEDEGVPGYCQGRKIDFTYPTPPSTPPPVALLAQLMTGKGEKDHHLSYGTSKTCAWAAAFMAGTEAESAEKLDGKTLDKA